MVPYYCAKNYEKIRSVHGAVWSKFTVKIRIAVLIDLGHLALHREHISSRDQAVILISMAKCSSHLCHFHRTLVFWIKLKKQFLLVFLQLKSFLLVLAQFVLSVELLRLEKVDQVQKIDFFSTNYRSYWRSLVGTRSRFNVHRCSEAESNVVLQG
jgi:hypothetical protein